MTWIDNICSVKGTANIATLDDMAILFQVIGELREALFKTSGKSGRTFAIVTPRIASFIASTVGAIAANRADAFEKGRIIPSTKRNAYVCSLGDLDIYQYVDSTIPGGFGVTTEMTGTIYVGLDGSNGPDASSVYYAPYKKYIVAGGSEYLTGQSTMWFRIRDAWCTNPQDTFDETMIDPNIDPIPNNRSQYIMKADIIFSESSLT